MKTSFLALKIAFRNLVRHSSKSLATLITMAAGFMAINLFEGYIIDTQQIFQKTYSQRLMYGDLVIRRSGAFEDSMIFDSTFGINEDQQKKLFKILKDLPEVETILPQLHFRSNLTNGKVSLPVFGIGVDIAAAEKMRSTEWKSNVFIGRSLSTEDDSQITVGESLGVLLECADPGFKKSLSREKGYVEVDTRKLKCSNDHFQISTMSQLGQMNAIDVSISGMTNAVFSEVDSRFVLMSIERAKVLQGTRDISLVTVKTRSSLEVPQLIEKLRSRFESERLPLVVEGWKGSAFGEIYRQSMSFLNVLRNFFLVVILFIVLFSVFSTQLRLVMDRYSEIGTFQSVGFRKALVYEIFLWEIVFLSWVGCAVGAMSSLLVGRFINSLNIQYKIGILSEDVGFYIDWSLYTLFVSALVISTIGIIATVIALQRSFKNNIRENLDT